MIRQGKESDKESLVQLWRCCFPDDPEDYIQFYYERVHADDQVLVDVENDGIVAALQMIPYQIKMGDSRMWGGYISGAMTHPDWRNKGYMSRLLNASFDVMREKGYACTFLIPQEKHLIDYYKKFGYESAFPEYSEYSCPAEPKIHEEVSVYIRPSADSFDDDYRNLYPLYLQFLEAKENVVLKTEPQYVNVLSNFFAAQGTLFANSDGQAYVFKRDRKIFIAEFFYRNEDVKLEFLQTIGYYFAKTEVIICNDPSSPVAGCKGMIKPLNNSVDIKAGIYLTQMLE